MGTRGTRGGTTKHRLPEWTEQSIQKVLNAQYMPRGKYIINNLFVFNGWESDYLAMTVSGYYYEVEIKVSLSDFKADFNKTDKHHVLAYGYDTHGKALPRPHFFSYAVPEPMVEKVRGLIPEYAGLVSVSANGFLTVVKAPVLLHRKKFTEAELRLTEKFYYNMLSWKERYNSYSKELAKYRAEINNLKAEFKAVTGKSFRDYLKDAL